MGVRAYAEVVSAGQTLVSVTIGDPNLLDNKAIRRHP
jgi:hypothetical protein